MMRAPLRPGTCSTAWLAVLLSSLAPQLAGASGVVFGAKQSVTAGADGARFAQAADVDGDGDLDALSASQGDDTIAWYENLDGQGSFGPEQHISTVADGAWSVAAADIDRDGDPDVLSASNLDSDVSWYENRSGQVEIATGSTAPPALGEGSQVELLRVDVTHLGRAGDADEELDVLELAFDSGPATPLLFGPAVPLTSLEAGELIDALHVYRDEGSGAFEPATDALVASVATLTLVGGTLAIDLPDAEPETQISAGVAARFFVVADLSPTAGSAVPNALRVRHVSGHSEILHVGTDIVAEQNPGSGTQARLLTIPEPAMALQLAAGTALLAALARRKIRPSSVPDAE